MLHGQFGSVLRADRTFNLDKFHILKRVKVKHCKDWRLFDDCNKISNNRASDRSKGSACEAIDEFNTSARKIMNMGHESVMRTDVGYLVFCVQLFSEEF